MIDVILSLVAQSDDINTGWLFPFMVCTLVIILSIVSLLIPLVSFASITLGMGVVVNMVISAPSETFRMFAVLVLLIAITFGLLSYRMHNRKAG